MQTQIMFKIYLKRFVWHSHSEENVTQKEVICYRNRKRKRKKRREEKSIYLTQREKTRTFSFHVNGIKRKTV